ncbi:sigma factor [Nocardia xishanensis]|uniref:sigma factor n=1 Tax=Nocardia xishanensis TaxID=238964 RepID=UPI001C3F8081
MRGEPTRPTDAEWASHQPAVFGAAYRILGTVTEAEDVAQDVWLRAVTADSSEVRDLRGLAGDLVRHAGLSARHADGQGRRVQRGGRPAPNAVARVH